MPNDTPRDGLHRYLDAFDHVSSGRSAPQPIELQWRAGAEGLVQEEAQRYGLRGSVHGLVTPVLLETLNLCLTQRIGAWDGGTRVEYWRARSYWDEAIHYLMFEAENCVGRDAFARVARRPRNPEQFRETSPRRFLKGVVLRRLRKSARRQSAGPEGPVFWSAPLGYRPLLPGHSVGALVSALHRDLDTLVVEVLSTLSEPVTAQDLTDLIAPHFFAIHTEESSWAGGLERPRVEYTTAASLVVRSLSRHEREALAFYLLGAAAFAPSPVARRILESQDRRAGLLARVYNGTRRYVADLMGHVLPGEVDPYDLAAAIVEVARRIGPDGDFPRPGGPSPGSPVDGPPGPGSDPVPPAPRPFPTRYPSIHSMSAEATMTLPPLVITEDPLGIAVNEHLADTGIRFASVLPKRPPAVKAPPLLRSQVAVGEVRRSALGDGANLWVAAALGGGVLVTIDDFVEVVVRSSEGETELRPALWSALPTLHPGDVITSSGRPGPAVRLRY